MNVLITGITGFVGSHLAKHFIAQGHSVRGLVRKPGERGHLAPEVKAELVPGDVTRPDTLPAALQGMDAIVHLVAIAYEHGGAKYEAINAQGTRNMVNAAETAAVKRFVYQSALAVDSKSPYGYLRTKGQGEDAVRTSTLDWTIVRPSVLVGPEDEFTNALARWLVITPFAFPLVGDGQARFQPLWVGDLVRVLGQILVEPRTIHRTYELGGPEHLTYEQMVKQILFALQRRRLLLKVPVPLMRPVVSGMEVVLPKPPATTSLLDLLNVDNTAELDSVEKNFGFKPRRYAEAIGFVNRKPFQEALKEAFSSE
jgi:NADH dehydrogenase